MSKSPSPQLRARIASLLESLATNTTELAAGRVEVATTCRSLLKRLLNVVSKQDTARRIVISLAPGSLSTLISVVECGQDNVASSTAVEIFLCLAASSARRVKRFVKHGIVDSTWKLLIRRNQVMESVKSNDRCLQTCLVALVKFGVAERNFMTRARLLGGVPVVCAIMKSASGVLLDPCLRLVKMLAGNGQNADRIVKSGAVDHLVKQITKASHSDMKIVKRCVDVLVALSKHRVVASGSAQQELVKVSMSLASHWMAGVAHIRSAKPGMVSSLLNLMKSLAKHEAGQQAILNGGGLDFLLKLIHTPSSKSSMKRLSNSALGILRSAFPRVHLPVKSLKPTLQFSVPVTPGAGQDPFASDEEAVSSTAFVQSSRQAPVARPLSLAASAEPSATALAHTASAPPLARRTVASSAATAFEVTDADASEESATPHSAKVGSSKRSWLKQGPGDLMDSLDIDMEYFGTFFAERKYVRPSGAGSPDLHCQRASPSSSETSSSSSEEAASASPTLPNDPPPTSIHHVLPFVHTAPCDLPPEQSQWTACHSEPQFKPSPHTYRQLVLEDADRFVKPAECLNRVVYDLDGLVRQQSQGTGSSQATPVSPVHQSRLHLRAPAQTPLSEELSEELVTAAGDPPHSELVFESRFECGNLRKAIQVREHEYDLVLNADINTDHHHQWFYFCVSNMVPGSPYRFNIINNEKPHSQYETGMQPVLFSLRDYEVARQSNAYREAGVPADFMFWKRVGTNICYYSNNVFRSPEPSRLKKLPTSSSASSAVTMTKTFYTATFTVEFPHEEDVCYLAYHYPYTYTRLQRLLAAVQSHSSGRDDILIQQQMLCSTVSGNDCPVLTITAPFSADPSSPPPSKQATAITKRQEPDHLSSSSSDEVDDLQPVKDSAELAAVGGVATCDDAGQHDLSSREYVVLTSRVHPGESNSSWVMEGILEFLVSDHALAKLLRQRFIFKIVPMLNPDGVINGHHRVSLSGNDLNRCWITPSSTTHPTISHSKGLLQYLVASQKSPRLFCDFHGHSRRKNIFMFGCGQGGISKDGSKALPTEEEVFPRLLSEISTAFSLRGCSFDVEKSKEATARIVGWLRLGITSCYTLESTYCGSDQGQYKGLQFSPYHLKEMGQVFCQALLLLDNLSGGTARLPLHELLRHADRPPSAIFCTDDVMAEDDDGDDSDDGAELACAKVAASKTKGRKKTSKTKPALAAAVKTDAADSVSDDASDAVAAVAGDLYLSDDDDRVLSSEHLLFDDEDEINDSSGSESADDGDA